MFVYCYYKVRRKGNQMTKNAFYLEHKKTTMFIVFEGIEYKVNAKNSGNAIANLAFKLSRKVSDLRDAKIIYKAAN